MMTAAADDDCRFNRACRESGHEGGIAREAAPVIMQLVLEGVLGQM